MKSKDIVKELLKESNMSQSELAEQLGLTQSHINGYLNRYDSMRVSSLVDMVEAMGFEVIVRDKRDKSKEWKVTDNGKKE